VSQLGQDLHKTFCVSCYAGVISAGSAGGDNSKMRSWVVMLLNKNKPSHLQVQNTWVAPGAEDSVEGPLVFHVVNSHKHRIAYSIRRWYKSHMNVDIAAKHTHFFDDNAACVETFKGFDYNAYQISCKSRDSTKHDDIGWCGGTAAEGVLGSGVHFCPKSDPRRRRSGSRRRRSSPRSHRRRSSPRSHRRRSSDENRNGAAAISEEISPQVSSTIGAMDEEEESAMNELATFESQEASNASSPYENVIV